MSPYLFPLASPSLRHLELNNISYKIWSERVRCIFEMIVVKFLKELSLVSDFKLKGAIRRFSKSASRILCVAKM